MTDTKTQEADRPTGDQPLPSPDIDRVAFENAMNHWLQSRGRNEVEDIALDQIYVRVPSLIEDAIRAYERRNGNEQR